MTLHITQFWAAFEVMSNLSHNHDSDHVTSCSTFYVGVAGIFRILISMLFDAERATDMSSSDVVLEELPQNIADESVKDVLSNAEAVSIDCIPDEILEYILSLTSPYCDFKSALQVSKRWYSVVKSMLLKLFLLSGYKTK